MLLSSVRTKVVLIVRSQEEFVTCLEVQVAAERILSKTFLPIFAHKHWKWAF